MTVYTMWFCLKDNDVTLEKKKEENTTPQP